MEFTSKSLGPVEVVTLNGAIEGNEGQILREGLSRQIADGRTRLLLDLTSVDFIDSSGLSALIGTLKATRRLGGNLGLLNPAPTVRSVLELTRLHRVLDIFSTECEGVAKLAG
jgi:anti-anti-sigma factor